MNRHTNTKAVLDRMARAIGHMGAVKRMIEEGRDCSEVLVQLAAVKAEIAGVSKAILTEHISHCLAEAYVSQDDAPLRALNAAIGKLL